MFFSPSKKIRKIEGNKNKYTIKKRNIERRKLVQKESCISYTSLMTSYMATKSQKIVQKEEDDEEKK